MPKSSSLKDNSIVIHPTSNHLIFGRSIDNEPIIVPHCIARKRKNNVIIKKSIINNNKISAAVNNKFTNAIKLASIAMKSSDIEHLFPFRDQPPLSELCQLNKEKFKIKYSPDLEYINIHYDEEFYVGFDACRMQESANYNLFWPYWGGKLCDDYSNTAVLQDLEDIWAVSIEKKLKIPRSEFCNYNLILLISDLVIRREVRWVVDMVLTKLQFNSVILQQENVCVTYSASLSTACVVNVHETDISISCVAEGISIPESRIKLLYGIGDVLCLFHYLLQRIGFSKDIQIDYSNFTDVEMLWNLYDSACDTAPVSESKLIPIKSSRQQIKYDKTAQQQAIEFLMSSEHIIAGLSLFYTTLICKEGPKIQLQCFPIEESEPDDPFDDFYLSLTSRDKKKQRLDESATNGTANNEEGDEDDPKDSKAAHVSSLIQESPGANKMILSNNSVGGISAAMGGTNLDINSQTGCNNSSTGGGIVGVGGSSMRPLALNDAVIKSIQRAMLSTTCVTAADDVSETGRQLCRIVLVGWPPRYPGHIEWLQNCLQDALARCGEVEVIYDTGTGTGGFLDGASAVTAAWKGASMIPLANSADDILISARDWRKYGSRAIREKAPFFW